MRPIFIGGCSRSGTTMLGSMLGGMAGAVCTPESQFKVDVPRALRCKLPDIPLADALGRIERHWRFQTWAVDASRYSRAVESYTGYGELLTSLVAAYASTVSVSDCAFWVDHTPSNIRHTHFLLELFPNAKFVHLIRDGRAVAASVLPLDWGPNSIVGAARLWTDAIAAGLAAESSLGRELVLRVSYEALLEEPEAQLRAICDFVGSDYREEMLGGGRFVLPSYTTNQHELVGKAPVRTRIDAWRGVLSPREIEVFEYFAGSLLNGMGYIPDYGHLPRGPSLRERISEKCSDVWRRYLVNSRRYHNRRDANVGR